MKRDEKTVIISIAMIFFSIVSAYVYSFHSYEWSSKPSDWGVIGDYVGGLLNPVISFVALYYLIKAYTTQKQELRETKSVLEKTEVNSKKLADAQVELAHAISSQLLLSKELHRVKILSLQIENKAVYLSFLQKELGRVSLSIANNHVFYDLNSEKRYSHDDSHIYRMEMIKKTRNLSEEILTLEKEVSVISEKIHLNTLKDDF